MTNPSKQRVVIDLEENGNFYVYSDPEVEVICRQVHPPGDELYRYGTYPIPEEWLRDKPVGFLGDGCEQDKKAQIIGEAFREARAARAAGGA